MFVNNLKIALRHLGKNKLFTFIKLASLVVGLLGCLLIGLYLQHELSYDRVHEKAARIVRVTMEYRGGGEVRHTGSTGNKVGPTLAEEFPEVEKSVRTISYDNVPVQYGDKLFGENGFFYADSTFFSIFTFPLLSGSPGRVLAAPGQVVLDSSTAKKYFGGENPMGKTMMVNGVEFQVAGVMADAPSNTQIKPRIIASFVSHWDSAPERETWWNANYGTFLLLRQPGDREKLESRIGAFMRSRASETGRSGDDYLTYHFEPLRDVHLRSSVEGNFEPNGDIRYIYLLSLVGLVILLIGITTYVNLTTAASLERSKEIGVQKVLGAGSGQLLQQHLGEAGVLSGLALGASLALTAPLLPLFNRLFGKALDAAPLFQPSWLLGLLALWAIITLLSGLYPAWVAARFKPIAAMKPGNLPASKRADSSMLRKSLVVFQFSITVFLLIGTMVLQSQMDYIRSKGLGYESSHVLVLPTDRRIVEKLDVVKAEFLQTGAVQSVSLAYETPTYIEGGYGIAKSVTGEEAKPVTALPADEDFLEAMGITLAAGSNFNRQDVEAVRAMYEGDTTVVRSILLNEKQAGDFGWTAGEAVNKQINFNGTLCRVKGVVEDFHFASLHEPVGNLVIFPDTWGNVLLVRLSGGDKLSRTLAVLEQKWRPLAPHRPFSYHFLDEEFDALYTAELQSTRLFTAGCSLAAFLACLGLLGLATYSIVQRTREIGIRKVLGASVPAIVGLLSGDFMKLVLIAFAIASPLAYYFLRQWLQNFAFHIELGWWMFAAAGASAVAVAFLAVSVQSIRAALANPVEALRSE